ncbi:MAG: YeiH family putative sulfate export transporter [Clostridia bacterium]|nr:YeiH family putative sulfate export transporter [Clostridia bacterium]
MIPGILFCFAMAMPAWILGNIFPIIGGPVFGILMGMIVVTIFPKFLSKKFCLRKTGTDLLSMKLEDGVKCTSKKILQYAIILLGFGMNLFNIIKVGGQSLFIMLFTFSSVFLVGFFVGKALKMEGKMATLITVGTSICGGSAIAATAPVIKAKDEDVAHAISTIFLFNVIAVFIFPALGHAFDMSDIGFGMWAGTAINDTSSVVAAATAWSNHAGNNTALEFATIVKLTRTLMIVPITLVLAVYTARKAQKGQNAEECTKFCFTKVFPWFVVGFVATAIVNTFFGVPTVSKSLVTIGKFMIVMAMTAIGLHTNLKKLITNGLKPIGLGVCCWLTVASVSFFVQMWMGML